MQTTTSNPTEPRRSNAGPGPGEAQAQTTEHLSQAAHETIDRAARGAAKVESSLRESASHAGEQAKATKERAAVQFDSALKRLDAFMHEHPVSAAGVAFAAGMLLSSLLRR